MGKIALLTLMGVLAGAGLPSAAEPAAGGAPTTRPRPDHRPALTDTAKAAAVQAGAGMRTKSGSDAPAAVAARSGKVTARADTVPSAKGRVDPVPHGGPATTSKGLGLLRGRMPGRPSPLSGLRKRARHICQIWTLLNTVRATNPM